MNDQRDLTVVLKSCPLDSELVADELARTRPLSVVMAERVARLREWAAARTVPAA